jgi:hypothetical protein
MSATPPPPAPAPGGDPKPRPDAKGFFRDHYAAMSDVPKSRYEADIPVFEARFGADHGYSRDELTKIIKEARDNARKAKEPVQPKVGGGGWGLKTWERWILGIVFGVYILASIGTIAFATLFKKIGWSWQGLQPYVVGIIVVGVVLGILSTLWIRLKDEEGRTSIYGHIVIWFALLIAAAGTLWVIVIIWQLAFPAKEEPASMAPPSQFTFDRAWTCSDDTNLPKEMFGDFGDTTGRPREWMRAQESGGLGILEDNLGQVCWLLTKESANTTYEARINVGTQDGIVIVAYAVFPRSDASAPAAIVPLRQAFSADKAEYRFLVPQNKETGPLLFFVAMKQKTFHQWTNTHQQFVIKS